VSRTQQFVLFPLGKKRFALPAAQVSELSRPDELQTFPHSTKLLAGVLVRRGKIVPVLDVAQIVIGPNAPARRFYLIANRIFGKEVEWTAIPVTGECELIGAEVVASTGRLPKYVVGLISLEGEIVEIIDLDQLAAASTEVA
jgi:chemotaxis signal transduction protein